MTTLEQFSRTAAKRYLQSIVFVDDEIYKGDTGKPVELSSDIPAAFKSPFVAAATQLSPTTEPTAVGIEAPSVGADKPETETAPPSEDRPAEAKPPYHPRQLVESFAREGMVCALYEPRKGFASGSDSEIFRLCERADVIILDWDLFGADGANIIPLIADLADLSRSTIPHHSRLCAIYTNKPNLGHIAGAIYDNLQRRELAPEPVQETTIIAGATRVVVWGKPDVVGRPAESKQLEVPEEYLAGRVIDEFASMHSGILPSYALHGMAGVRRNSKRILDKFHRDMDAAFLLHRASVLANEDAFQQLPELLAEEVLAVLVDDDVTPDETAAIAREFAAEMDLGQLDWPALDKASKSQRQDIAKRFLGGGEEAISAEYKLKAKDKFFEQFHKAMGCDKTQADKRLAALFNLRTRYDTNTAPGLGLGTVIRRRIGESELVYGLCLMPVCDSIRLDVSAESKTMFPFWTLKKISQGDGPSFVVPTKEGNFEELVVAGKPRDMLWTDKFTPSSSGTVVATGKDGSFWFQGESRILEWVAQLKPAHAQRVAFHIGQSFSRVAVLEAEWLRLLSDRKRT